MKLRAAMLGCGRIGSAFADDAARIGVYSHAGAYAACRDTQLVAVCDRDGERARACARRWDVRQVFTDPATLLATAAPELVSICTPDETHEALLRQVLLTPGVRGVLMEKPLTPASSSSAALVRLAERRGVVLAVNYSRRYAASHRRLRAHLLAGRLGRLQAVLGLYGKGTLHSGTHWFDLARWFFGEVVAVRGLDTLGESGPDPTLAAQLTFASGLTAALQATDHAAYSVFEMDIVGSRGRVRITESGHAFTHSRVGPSPHYSGYRVLRPARGLAGGMRDVTLHAVRDLVRCLRQGGSPVCTGRDAVAAVRIALAVRSSAARRGRVVRLREAGA